LVGDEIASGTYGKVHRGLQRETNRRVAIKIVSKLEKTDAFIASQRREIEILSLLKHPNVVELLDWFEDKKSFYLVLEYLEGGDLFDFLERRKFKASCSVITDFICQIANGLAALHSVGVIHRDLKPENIMLTNDSDGDTLKLVDFGLSKIATPNEVHRECLGTLQYAAPELLLKSGYSFKVDSWSLGVILYMMLFGMLPFEEQTDQQTMEKIVYAPIPLPKRQGLDQSYVDLLCSLLSRDPHRRLSIDQVRRH